MYNPNEWSSSPETKWRRSVDVQKEDLNLKRIMSKNIEKTASAAKKPRPDLVDNFHWVIMRFRRQKKLTQEQFAKEISEPLADIIKAEQGILPEKDYILVRKIENFLGIRLIKDATLKIENPVTEQATKPTLKVLRFKPDATKGIIIADIKRIQEERLSMLGQSKEERKSLDVSRINQKRNSPDISRIKERKEFETPSGMEEDSKEDEDEKNF